MHVSHVIGMTVPVYHLEMEGLDYLAFEGGRLHWIQDREENYTN